MKECEACGSKYDTTKSKASLKNTYCTIMCECGPKGVGFDINAFINNKYSKEKFIQKSKIDVVSMSSTGKITPIETDEDLDNRELVTA